MTFEYRPAQNRRTLRNGASPGRRRGGTHHRRRSPELLISRDPEVFGGAAYITGTHIRVSDVISCLVATPPNAAQILEVLGSISTRQFEAAKNYYRSHFLEIEAEIARDQESR
jgi:uncharacterized protein (DUF433 family)